MMRSLNPIGEYTLFVIRIDIHCTMMRSLNLIGEYTLFVIRIDIHCTMIMCLHCGASMSSYVHHAVLT